MFALLKATPHVKDWWETYYEQKDYWHFGTGVALWYRCCPSWQLTLVLDLSSGTQNEGNLVYAG